MSLPKKHHFVPRCYLANFANTDWVYVLDIKKIKMGYNETPRLMNTAGICYLPHYYLIKRDYQNATFKLPKDNELTIEVDVLKRQEDMFPKWYSSLINGNINTNDANDFCDFIISMKLRNPYYLNVTLSRQLGDWTKAAVPNLLQKLNEHEAFKNKQPAEKEAAIKKIISENISDLNYAKQVQLYSLHYRAIHKSRNEVLRNAILKSQWKICKSPDIGPFFITSDNPGVSTCKKGLLYNTRFANGYTFYFPLSPKHCLVVSDKEFDFTYQNGKKEISLFNADTIDVYEINNKLIQLINNLVIANEDSYLSQITSLNKPKEER